MIDQLQGQAGEELSLQRVFDASPERVFAAWTNPQLLKRWWGPVGCKVTKVEIDLRVNGRYRLGVQQEGMGEYFVSGTYQEIRPPHKLVFTWRWERPDMDIGNSLVTIEFRPRGNRTELYLTHSQLPSPEACAAHREGWIKILENLSESLSNL